MKKWRYWFLCVTVVLIVGLGFDRLQMMYWVGGTDLEFEFAVIDAATGQPIEGAEIEVYSGGGFYKERDETSFKLSANEAGIARRICHDNTCIGVMSGLRFTDTFGVYLQCWRFHVWAPGYQRSELIHLHEPENVKPVQRLGPGKAKLVIPISLQKSQRLAMSIGDLLP